MLARLALSRALDGLAYALAPSQLPQATMMRCGLVLNVVCPVVTAAMMYGMYWS